jgi:hypothetical protein
MEANILGELSGYPKPPRGQALATMSVSACFWILAMIALCLRLWTRAFIVRCVGIDDWLMLVTVVSVYSSHRKQNYTNT